MITVEATKVFIDRENDMKERQVGEIFEVKPERAKYLEILGFVKTVKKAARKAD